MDMTIQEIANDINTTKQNVNQILKRAMRKVYLKTKELNNEWSPLEILYGLSCLFNIKQEKDFKRFFSDFPKDIQNKVINSLSSKNKSNIFKEMNELNGKTFLN